MLLYGTAAKEVHLPLSLFPGFKADQEEFLEIKELQREQGHQKCLKSGKVKALYANENKIVQATRVSKVQKHRKGD